MSRTKFILLWLLLFVSLAGFGCSFFARKKIDSPALDNRIRFDIRAIEETDSERRIVSETTIEGLPGTDFNINLQTERFNMQARFLTDFSAPDKIKIRAKLNTRRLYGRSERQLPLYEEDAQSKILEIGFDETVVLLPFGRGGDGESLKIEITPQLLQASNQDTTGEPLKINIVKPAPNGEITVDAFKIPHRFRVEAVLLAGGQEVARGAGDYLLEEAREIVLQTNERADAEISQTPFVVKAEINKFTHNPPSNLAGISFEIYRNEPAADGQKQMLVSSGSGVGVLGGELNYRLNQMPGDKKYELRFRISESE